MNSNPSFYPKHLAKQYVGVWNGDQVRSNTNPLNQPPAGNFSFTNVNGQRSVTPVSVGGSPNHSMSPNAMDSSVSSRHQEPGKKILQGLPDSFIVAMRRLFDLLDVTKAGRVHILDISENWSPDATGSVLPPNIVPSLRKVMTPDGYLTFERFCAGLKICILRHSAQRHRQADNDSSNDTEDPSLLSRTNSLPNLYSCGSDSNQSDCSTNGSNISSHHTNSPVNYECDSAKLNTHEGMNKMYGPPKPPRDPNRITSSNLPKMSEDSLITSRNIAGSTSSLPAAMNARSQNDIVAPQFIWKPPPPPFISQSHFDLVKRGNKNNEMSTLVKAWEQENQLLEEGLGLLHDAQQYYKDRVMDVQNRIKRSNKSGNFSNSDLDQTNREVATLRDSNTRLKFLISNSPKDQRNICATESLSTITSTSQHELLRRIERLQEQNRLLTDEVSRQSNKVTGLEHDKQTLIKQLFQQSSTTSISSSASNASTLR